jgi:hypothetical protein
MQGVEEEDGEIGFFDSTMEDNISGENLVVSTESDQTKESTVDPEIVIDEIEELEVIDSGSDPSETVLPIYTVADSETDPSETVLPIYTVVDSEIDPSETTQPIYTEDTIEKSEVVDVEQRGGTNWEEQSKKYERKIEELLTMVSIPVKTKVKPKKKKVSSKAKRVRKDEVKPDKKTGESKVPDEMKQRELEGSYQTRRVYRGDYLYGPEPVYEDDGVVFRQPVQLERAYQPQPQMERSQPQMERSQPQMERSQMERYHPPPMERYSAQMERYNPMERAFNERPPMERYPLTERPFERSTQPPAPPPQMERYPLIERPFERSTQPPVPQMERQTMQPFQGGWAAPPPRPRRRPLYK